MSRFKLLGFAAISWLSLFTVARATTYDATTDWASTYANTAAIVAANTGGTATWGAGGIWSAGDFSFNWTNQEAESGNSSLQVLQTYYLPSTGYQTNGATIQATYIYTVPWVQYQFNPGSTIHQQVGTALTAQIASGHAPEKAGGSDSDAPTLPTGMTSGGTTSGYIIETGAAKVVPGISSAAGFTTTAYNGQNSFNDGDGSEQNPTAGVFYNYGANATSTKLAGLNMPASSTNDVLDTNNIFGPTYIAWTAPANGTVTSINTSAYDIGGTKPSDGDPGFYVVTSTAGPTAPIFSASNWGGGGSPAGTQYFAGAFSVGGATTTIAGGTIQTPTSSIPTAYSTEGVDDIQWISGSFAVTAGEVLYFVNDPMHSQFQTHGNHTAGDGIDELSIGAQVSFVPSPEPASIVLLGIAGVGLALVARRNRRRVTA